jgi:peptide/nickel transport system ATP-binding protein
MAGREALAVNDLIAWHARSRILHGISLTVRSRACVAVVGESGSGKTTLARCIAGMHPTWEGTATLGGAPLEKAARRRSLQARRAIQYVFQNPYAALNPRRTIAEILAQWLDVLGGGADGDRGRLIEEALAKVGLADDVLGRYADELSGGQQQRVALARALACRPAFLICDEVTSALDVSVQAAIVGLLERLRRDEGLGILFITHNLALVRSIADYVLVMRGGCVVESAATEVLFTAPAHPYTRELLRLTPSLDDVGDPP